MPIPLAELLRFKRDAGMAESPEEKAEQLDREELANIIRNQTDLPPIPGIKTEAWQHQRQQYFFAVMLWTGETPQEHCRRLEREATDENQP